MTFINSQRVKLLAESVQDYVIKPFSANELRARVRNLIITKRARNALQKELALQNESLLQLTQQLIASRQLLQQNLERKESEQRWRAVFENSGVGIGLTEVSGRFIAVNPVLQRMLGYLEEELLQLSILEITPKEDREITRSLIAQLLAGKLQDYHLEKSYLRRDGSLVWAIASVSVIPGNESTGPMLVIVVEDITERKKAEAESLALKNELAAEIVVMTRLQELSTRWLSSTELQPFLEEILAAVVEMQKADFGNVQLYDPETRELIIVAQRGFHQELQDHYYSVHEDSAICRRALEMQARIIIEDVLTDPEFEPHRQIAASARFRAVQSTPLFSRNGEPLGMISTLFRLPHRPSERELRLTDLYARQGAELIECKRVEAALRRSEAHLAEGQRISHTGSWVWNISSGEILWSQEHLRIFGLDPEQVRPSYETFFELLHPEDQSRVKQGFEDAVNERTDFAVTYRIIRPDGMIKHIHSLAHPVFNELGDLSEYVGTVIDITERKKAEEVLAEMQAELERVTRVTTMGELAASIAHEVNQPLGAIVTNGQACLRLISLDSPDNDKLREIVEHMISDGLRASEVISRIRKMLKKADPEKSRLNINEAIQEVIALTIAELKRNEIRLQIELGRDLPMVLGDRIQLQQVILNLILNGKDAMNAAGWQPRELQITTHGNRNGEVLVEVRDSGTGIDPLDCDRIFDPFFTTKSGGMGLGLSISRTIIESHSGKLWATPNKGIGTTVRFTLPVDSRC
jgi:PAS domain S-box-containing protein